MPSDASFQLFNGRYHQWTINHCRKRKIVKRRLDHLPHPQAGIPRNQEVWGCMSDSLHSIGHQTLGRQQGSRKVYPRNLLRGNPARVVFKKLFSGTCCSVRLKKSTAFTSAFLISSKARVFSMSFWRKELVISAVLIIRIKNLSGKYSLFVNARIE